MRAPTSRAVVDSILAIHDAIAALLGIVREALATNTN